MWCCLAHVFLHVYWCIIQFLTPKHLKFVSYQIFDFVWSRNRCHKLRFLAIFIITNRRPKVPSGLVYIHLYMKRQYTSKYMKPPTHKTRNRKGTQTQRTASNIKLLKRREQKGQLFPSRIPTKLSQTKRTKSRRQAEIDITATEGYEFWSNIYADESRYLFGMFGQTVLHFYGFINTSLYVLYDWVRVCTIWYCVY